jgi:hypothetical protein
VPFVLQSECENVREPRFKSFGQGCHYQPSLADSPQTAVGQQHHGGGSRLDCLRTFRSSCSGIFLSWPHQQLDSLTTCLTPAPVPRGRAYHHQGAAPSPPRRKWHQPLQEVELPMQPALQLAALLSLKVLKVEAHRNGVLKEAQRGLVAHSLAALQHYV